MIKEIFSYFDQLNMDLDNPILEISIKQSQMVFCFEEMNSITISDLEKLNNISPFISISKITTYQDIIYVHFEGLSESVESLLAESKNIKDTRLKESHLAFFKLHELIFRLTDILCTCPALECLVSGHYVKVYIDLPNVSVKQAFEVDGLLESDGMLELNSQRPYILYVKDW